MQSMRKGIESKGIGSCLTGLMGNKYGCRHREGTIGQRNPKKSKASPFPGLFSTTENQDCNSNDNKDY